MDRLPTTASSPHDDSSTRYIYDHHQLNSQHSSSLHSPPPTASSTTMSISYHWNSYPLDAPRRPTTTDDALLSRPKSMHSEIDSTHHHVFSHVPQSFNQRIPQEGSYQPHHIPNTYRSHIPPSYSDLPQTSSPLGAGSVRAPSPTNSAESSSVINHPPTRATAPPMSLPDLPYASSDNSAYSSVMRLPVVHQAPWMTIESQSPAYNSVFMDPTLRPVDGDYMQHPLTSTTMTVREPSASPEPDHSSPSLIPTLVGHSDARARSHSGHSPSANGHQDASAVGHRDAHDNSIARVSPSSAQFQYPTSPSYPQPSPSYGSYPGYRNGAVYTPFNQSPHSQIFPQTQIAYPYPPPSREGPVLPPSQSIPEAPVAPAPPAPVAPPPAPPSQVPATTRTNSKTKTKLTDMDRKFICVFAASNPKARQEDIATKFAVERSTVSKILKCKDKWMKVDFFSSEARTVKHRPSKFPEIEAELIHHIRMKLASREPINDSFIKKTALALADERGIGRDKFKASSGWVENFKHRHDIRRGGVFSSGDRPGAIPIPGAVLSVPGNGGSLPADGSSGVIIGAAGSTGAYNGYDAGTPVLDDTLRYNGAHDPSYDAQQPSLDTATASTIRQAATDFPHYRSGVKTRSMRSDSFASQRPSTMSSVDTDVRGPLSQDPSHGDVAFQYDHHALGSSPACDEPFLPSQDVHFPGSYPSAGPDHRPHSSHLVTSPASMCLPHLPGSPIHSPAPSNSGVGSPGPAGGVSKSISPFGSSPMPQHLDVPGSARPMSSGLNSRPLTAPHSPKPAGFGARMNSYPRRHVTFSEYTHGNALKNGLGASRPFSLGENNGSQFQHQVWDHSHARPLSVGRDGPHNHELPAARFPETSAADAYRIRSPRRNLSGLVGASQTLGEPLIAEYGCDEPPYPGGFIGDSALILDQIHPSKVTPSTRPTNITIE